MPKQFHHLPATSGSKNCFGIKNSEDESSDSDSLAASCKSFVAVPKEFRPDLHTHPKLTGCTRQCIFSEEGKTSSPSNFQSAASKNTLDHPLSETAHSKNQKSHSLEYNQMFSRETSVPEENYFFEKDGLTTTKIDRSSKKGLEASNTVETKTVIKYKVIVKETAPSQQVKKRAIKSSSQMQKGILHPKLPSRKSKKNPVKYECSEKRGHGRETIYQNFEIPLTNPVNYPTEDGCRCDPVVNRRILKQQNEGAFKKTKIKRNQNAEEIWQRDTLEENIVKLDNALTLDDDSDSEQDGDSDSEQDLIEWTVIKEENTVVSTRKTKSRKQVDKKGKNGNFSNTHAVKKPNKYYQQNRFNNAQIKDNADECNTPKISIKSNVINQQDINTVTLKNNFLLNNGFKNILKDSRYDAENEYSYLDEARLQQKVRISPHNFTNQNTYKNMSMDLQNCSENKHDSERKMQELKKSDYRNDGDISQNQKFSLEPSKETEELMNYVLVYGREMSDLIIGSHGALSMFISFYKEWIQSRLQLIDHFENLEMNLKESSEKYTKYKDIINLARNGASIASAIPLPHVSIAAKVISVLTGLFSAFVSASEKRSSEKETEKSSEITTAVFRDTQASSDLYMYGLQCHQQFQETVKMIEEFHSNIKTPEAFEKDSPEMATFLQGMLEYKPNNRIFYKKLHKCFRELLQNNTSNFSKRFCEPFTLYSSDAVDVTGFLDWRFRYEDFNSQSVRYEVEQIHQTIESVDSISIKNLIVRIRSCINILRDELTFVEGCVKHIPLFNDSDELSKKTQLFT